MSSCRTKRGMCKSGGINLTGNGFWSDKVSVSFVVRSDRDLAFVTISLSKKATIRDRGMWMWLKGYHLPYLSLHIQQRRRSSIGTMLWRLQPLKLVRSLTVSERRKGTWVVYVEPRDARLEWANGVSRWFRLFRWIEMMGSDKQYVWGCQDILSSIKDWHVGFPALPNVVHFRKFPEHPRGVFLLVPKSSFCVFGFM